MLHSISWQWDLPYSKNTNAVTSAPYPPIQRCYTALLGRAFEKVQPLQLMPAYWSTTSPRCATQTNQQPCALASCQYWGRRGGKPLQAVIPQYSAQIWVQVLAKSVGNQAPKLCGLYSRRAHRSSGIGLGQANPRHWFERPDNGKQTVLPIPLLRWNTGPHLGFPPFRNNNINVAGQLDTAAFQLETCTWPWAQLQHHSPNPKALRSDRNTFSRQRELAAPPFAVHVRWVW